MPDLRARAAQGVALAARAVRRAPGALGGYGTFFAARDRLDHGTTTGWREDAAALLELSSKALARGRVAGALSWYDKALRLAFHASVHNRGGSPLVADPEAFLDPLRTSPVGRILLDGQVPHSGESRRTPPRKRAAGEPVRLLVIAQENWTFIRPVLTALEATGGFIVHELEVDDLPDGERPDRKQVLRARYDAVTRGTRIETPARVAEEYGWADTVLVEWGHHVLTWVTLLDQVPRRLIARFHRFEAFTPFPLLHDPDPLDRVLYVAPALRALIGEISPQLGAVPAEIVANLLPRGLGGEPAADRDLHLLSQVGWNREIKDVLFTLDLLERLRDEDPRFRLQLIGPGLSDDPADDTAFQRRVRRRLDELGPSAVQQLGVRRDVPEVVGRGGFIVSSSFHEGTHESIMEGLAAGCVAVVRDWPDIVPYGGAATVYAEDSVVSTVEEAADRVRELSDPVAFGDASRESRRFAVARRDPQTIVRTYERVLAP